MNKVIRLINKPLTKRESKEGNLFTFSIFAGAQMKPEVHDYWEKV